MNPIHRYDLHGETHSNWAVVLLTSDGFFMSDSDFGAFCYRWSAHACKDFREFFLGKDESWHYFASKFAGGKTEFDGDKTTKRLLEWILASRKRKEMSKDNARELWDAVRERWFEEASEQISYAHYAELQTFLDAWIEKAVPVAYFTDESRIVLRPKDDEEEACP
jgi:hypothetical protein